MATAEDYASWIVKNSDKKGTPEFETVAKAYKDAMATESTSGITAQGVLHGMGKGVRDIVSGALSLPATIADVVTAPMAGAYNLGRKAYNQATDSSGGYIPIIGRTQGQIDQALNAVGLPDTGNPLISAVTKGVAGSASGIGVGRALASSAVPAAKKLAELLSSAPKTQMISSAAAPAAGEIAKEAGIGPGGQLAAELGTGLATGGLSSLVKPRMPAITSEEFSDAASKAYDQARKAGVVFKPEKITEFADSMKSTLADEGLDPILTPMASRVVKNIEKIKDQPLDLKEIDKLRRQAGIAAGNFSVPADTRLGMILKNKIDDFVNSVTPEDVISGQTREAASALTHARDMYSRSAKLDAIDEIIRRAELRGGNYSASGYENALRNEFKALALNKKEMSRFTEDEQAAIEDVVRGGPISNALRFFGRFSPTGPVGGVLAGAAGAALGGPVGAAATLGAGATSRQLAKMLTKQRAESVSDIIRRGPKGQKPEMSEELKKKLIAALQGTQMGVAAQEQE